MGIISLKIITVIRPTLASHNAAFMAFAKAPTPSLNLLAFGMSYTCAHGKVAGLSKKNHNDYKASNLSTCRRRPAVILYFILSANQYFHLATPVKPHYRDSPTPQPDSSSASISPASTSAPISARSAWYSLSLRAMNAVVRLAFSATPDGVRM
jgi:hypothetical protein